MSVLSLGLSLVLALVAGVSLAQAQENSPLQEPQLRIEAGMHTAAIMRLGVSADGKLLVTGGYDKTARLWALPSGQLIRPFRVPIGPANEGKVYAVAISPDGRLIAAGGWDAYRSRNLGQEGVTAGHFVYLFDTVSGALVGRLGPLPTVISDLEFSPDGKFLAAGLAGGDGIRIWSQPFDGDPLVDLTPYDGAPYQDSVFNIAFDPSGSGRFATTADDGMIRLYDSPALMIPKVMRASNGNVPFGVAFSPDGKTLAVAYDDVAKIELFSVPDLSRVHAVDTSFAKSGALGTVAFSKDGKSLYAGGRYTQPDNKRIIRWPDAGRGAPIKLGGPGDTILDLVPLSTGIVYGSGDSVFGAYDKDDRQIFVRTPATADMRQKHSGRFLASADATGVWFGLKFGDGDPWRFDVSTLSFAAAESKPSGYVEPKVQAGNHEILGWLHGEKPTLDKLVIPLKKFEVGRSLAIAPDEKSFILGTDWAIHRFDMDRKEIPPYPIDTDEIAWGVNLSAEGSITIAALADGTIRWYRTEDGALLLSFFVHVPDKRWIVWTPSGYYAASPGGEDLIGWHVNGKSWDAPVEFLPASLFRNRFYRPDIVQLVLKTKDEARAIQQANIIAKRKSEEVGLDQNWPPVVEIFADPRGTEANTPEFALKYRLRSPSGKPITRLELRVDGQLTQSRAITVLDESLTLDTDLVMTVPLPPRDAIVSLTAFIDDQAGEAAQISVRWTGRNQGGPKPKLYALVVGVSAYDEPKLKLNYAAKDATDVDAALKRQKGRFFEDVQTVSLLDKDATEDRIEIELSKLRRKVGPNDYAVVFMAGHGVTDAQGGFHFLPANASLVEDELGATSLNGLIIRDNLRTMQGKVLLFIDACNAGNGISGGQALADMTGFANEFAQSNGVVMYAASTGRQFSYENAQWGNGAFTKALIETLDDPRAFGDDRRLSIFEMAEQLSAKVEALTAGLQTPVMTKSAAIPNFHFASIY